MTGGSTIVLAPELLPALGGLLAEPQNALSVLRGPAVPPTPEVREALRAAGVVHADGRIDPAVGPTLRILAAPTRMVGLSTRLASSASLDTDLVVCWDDDRAVTLGRTAGQAIIVNPAELDHVAGVALGLVGASPWLDGTFEAEFSPGAVALLMTVVDHQRVAVLRAAADGRPLEPPPVERARLAVRQGSGLLSLAELVQVVDDRAAAWGPDDEATLVRGGFLETTPSGLQLAGASIALAAQLLWIKTIITLSAGTVEPDGSAQLAAVTWVQAGVHDVLAIERTPDGVRLELVSAASVVAAVSAALAGELPALLPAPAAPSAPVAPATAWTPTHRVPAAGLPTWPQADPAAPPGPRLDPGLEVALVERLGDWAHVKCSNGWTCWVDGRLLLDR